MSSRTSRESGPGFQRPSNWEETARVPVHSQACAIAMPRGQPVEAISTNYQFRRTALGTQKTPGSSSSKRLRQSVAAIYSRARSIAYDPVLKDKKTI